MPHNPPSSQTRLDVPAAGTGVNISSSTAGQQISIEPEDLDPAFVRQNFTARIVAGGPNEEPDFPDARYWIREVRLVEHDPEGEDRARWFNEDEYPDADRVWTDAVNLSEVKQANRGQETHRFAPPSDADDGMIVQVHAALQPNDRIRYYFATGSGTESHYCVCRDIVSPNSWFVKIQLLKMGTQPGEFEFAPGIIEAICRPGTLGRHFEHLVYAGNNANSPMMQSLDLELKMDNWFVTPWAKQARETIPWGSLLAMSDCNPLRTLE